MLVAAIVNFISDESIIWYDIWCDTI